jgi:aryl-alcohol dehydrogenase-like predicted oxidoreductase
MKFHRRDWRRRVFRDDLFDQTLHRVEKIRSLVDGTEPLAHTALRFCLSHTSVTTVILGVRTPEQAAEDLTVLELHTLDPALLQKCTQLWNDEFCSNVRTSVGEDGEG